MKKSAVIILFIILGLLILAFTIIFLYYRNKKRNLVERYTLEDV